MMEEGHLTPKVWLWAQVSVHIDKSGNTKYFINTLTWAQYYSSRNFDIEYYLNEHQMTTDHMLKVLQKTQNEYN